MSSAASTESESRQHEARELRRAYWQRELGRISVSSSAPSPRAGTVSHKDGLMVTR